jgi:hypothetical protein
VFFSYNKKGSWPKIVFTATVMQLQVVVVVVMVVAVAVL